MELEERKELVLRSTEEVVTEEELEELLEERDKPVAYMGDAPTGRMHTGHFITHRKIADFLRAGFEFKVLLADLHAHLDDLKTPFELLKARSEYYEECIKGMMEVTGVDWRDLEFIEGREYQLDRDYILEVLRMAADTTSARCQRAASEVVRYGDHPRLGGYIYPLMQTEDIVALDADVAYGGLDQRGIYMLSRELLPKFGHEKPICVFAPLLTGLTGGKMSASVKGSKINLVDPPKKIKEKIMEAYCPAGEKRDNGILEHLKWLIFPILNSRGEELVVRRPEKYGGDLAYEDYDELEEDFLSEELHPEDLKKASGGKLAEILEPIRERFEGKEELIKEAYPDEEG
ncbi:tyrosyl-tRNA synthetase [candidate division MSBL1 archaeon SCGC-AAA259A05]|uniref:Tyrosine--tRNA ligase n=1 Tax=candidate division MSBL1 archaeon SCGC-AAA259A05 TaxID=1698259 RepID=A0A133U9Z5_9EURY|nr:tyrosyl-tRNA synthetase [candidate division MSBL1 archaeon SCGC-AAA259A05]